MEVSLHICVGFVPISSSNSTFTDISTHSLFSEVTFLWKCAYLKVFIEFIWFDWILKVIPFHESGIISYPQKENENHKLPKRTS